MRPDGYPPPNPPPGVNPFEWIIAEAQRLRQAARWRSFGARKVSAPIRPGDRRL